MKERILCSCGGENDRCYRCGGSGWYEEHDPDRPLKLPGVAYPTLSTKNVRSESEAKRASKDSRRRIVLSTDPLPPNGNPDTRPKRPIKTLPPEKLLPARADTYKPQWEVRRLRFRKNAFNCRFDAKRIKASELPLLAGKALARLLKDTDGAFLKRSTLLSMRIPSSTRAQVFVMADQFREEKYDLMFADITAWLRVVMEQPSIKNHVQRHQGKTPLEDEPHRSNGTSGASGRVNQRDADRIERQMDATRDYRQLRDHGEFGSHPSHDDYD